jgi:hypothetical protein
MLHPNVLSIVIKGQVFDIYVQVQYPLHDEKVMEGIHQRVKGIGVHSQLGC